MVESDVQLIHRILSGDDDAFSLLVQKYQKSVHALVWRKIGDFHIAEEITQDTFLRVYKSLATLKDPKLFAGWLYVIANRLCLNWRKENGAAMQSLEDTSMREIEASSYRHYLSNQRETETSDRHYEIVQKLLQKLPESERTVVILYYLGEMTAKEIAKFLGVSVNTIKSRIRRARERLQNQEELLISETLGSLQLPADLTQSIMRQIADIKQQPAPVRKPMLPWAASATAAVLIILFIGVSSQYLPRFQQPYNFKAQSEPTIEIVDAPITLDIDAKPTVKNQTGRAFNTDKDTGNGLQASETVSPTDTLEISPKFSTSQWTHTNAPEGSNVLDIFVTPEKTLYAVTPSGIYRLTTGATAWTLINTSIPIGGNSRMPMAQYADTLYIVSTNEIFTSNNGGDTWKALGPRPKGNAVGLIIVSETEHSRSHTAPAMYLAIQDKGVFRSTDAGAHWTLLNDGLTDIKVSEVAAIGDTVFAGTNTGLYRLNSAVWEQMPIAASEVIHALVVSENSLYIVTGHDLFTLGLIESRFRDDGQIIHGYKASSSRILCSTDLGASWIEITPKNRSPFQRTPTGMKLVATGETLLLLGTTQLRSTDNGQTWVDLGSDENLFTQGSFSTVAIDDKTFYNVGTAGVHQTTDAGESWQPFMKGMAGNSILDLVAFNDRLYMHTGNDVFQSTDAGASWKNVPIHSGGGTLRPVKSGQSQGNFSRNSRLVTADNALYGIIPEEDDLRLFHLSLKRNMFVPVDRIPSFSQRSPFNVFTREALAFELWTTVEQVQHVYASDGLEEDENLPVTLYFMKKHWGAGGFAVSGETFYVECQRRLFRWKPDSAEWKNTGLIDTTEQLDSESDNGFKLAASAETVYVGKRDGKLLQSLDSGDSWKNITSSLPLHFTRFNEIVFVDTTVYIATDSGVLSSQDGEYWRVITDRMGTCPIIDRFAVHSATLYGAADTGIYRLEGEWQQVSPNVTGKVISLSVSNDKLYIATEQHGLFHIALGAEEWVGMIK